jgi:hypothetical protein
LREYVLNAKKFQNKSLRERENEKICVVGNSNTSKLEYSERSDKPGQQSVCGRLSQSDYCCSAIYR